MLAIIGAVVLALGLVAYRANAVDVEQMKCIERLQKCVGGEDIEATFFPPVFFGDCTEVCINFIVPNDTRPNQVCDLDMCNETCAVAFRVFDRPMDAACPIPDSTPP